MSSTTAGKGPGITLCNDDRTGAVRLSFSRKQRFRAALQVANFKGASAEVLLSERQVRALARALLKVADALSASEDARKTTEVAVARRTSSRGSLRR